MSEKQTPEITVREGTTYTEIFFPLNDEMIHSVGGFVKNRATEFEFNPRFKRWFPTKRFFLYESRRRRLVIPRGFTELVLDCINEHGFPYKTDVRDPVTLEQVSIPMDPGFEPWPIQQGPIDYLSTDKAGMYALPLQTGQGKTCIAIAAMSKLGMRSMIVTSGLVEQWAREISKFTQIEDLYIIQGYKSVSELFRMDMKPSVILCSLETLRLFVLGRGDYSELPLTYGQFLEHYGIGTKIMDEVHEKYHAIVLTDLLSDVRNNIYLSATFTRNDSNGRRIFSTIYPPQVLYDAGRYQRYCRITLYGYAIYVSHKTVMKSRGYMHAKFEREIVKKKTKLTHFTDEVLKKAVDMHFINIRSEGEKLLIYFQTNEMVRTVQERLQMIYPDLKIVCYIADASDELHEDPDVDIILSSPRKSGRGTDIKNLRTVINTVSTQAETTLIQMLGRLRKLSSGNIPEFVDLYNRSIDAHIRHRRWKHSVLRGRGLEFQDLALG